jgi:hypothetical protein
MSASLIGKERLGAVLDGNQRVVVTNGTSLVRGVRVQAIALGLHASDGSVRFRTWTDGPLEPGESEVLEDDRPREERIIAVEAFFRLTVLDAGQILECYARLAETATLRIGDIEVGVTELEGAPTEGETPIEEMPGLAVFAQT